MSFLAVSSVPFRNFAPEVAPGPRKCYNISDIPARPRGRDLFQEAALLMKRFARTALFVALTALIALGFTGCSSIGAPAGPAVTPPPMTAELYTDYDAVYAHYNSVTFEDTLDTLTERFGEPETVTTANGANYTWIMEDGYGFTCAFHPTGELLAKVIHYEDVRQFRDLSSSGNLDIVEEFDKSVTFQECLSFFAGRPIEIAQIHSDAAGDDINRVYTWIDAEDNMVQILFKADGTVDSVSYSGKQ